MRMQQIAKLAIALATGMVAACGDDASLPAATSTIDQPADARASSGMAITSVGDLRGEYRVAGIDGAPLQGNRGIAVSIDGPLLSFEPTCAGFVWEVYFAGDMLELKRWAQPQPTTAPGAAPMPEPAKCAIGLLPEWEQLAGALDVAERAERTPANAILLSGNGRSVTLFTQ